MAKSAVDVVFGVASFGYEAPACTDKAALQSILDEFKKHGHNELDNARVYGNGTSETFLGDIKYAEQGLILDTKVTSFAPGAHTPEKIAESVAQSLQQLKAKKVNILYLHAPDRHTPFEVTLEAINEEYKKGHFEEFGLSNYKPEEVEQFVKIAKEKGFVAPTVYQGLYNLLVRGGEDKLFPVLRKHGIRFFAYSPLAGSFLTGQVTKNQEVPHPRFDTATRVGKLYSDKFIKDSHFEALEKLKEVADKHGLSLSEVALRWLAHHSLLKRETKDAIIIGGKTFAHVQHALDDLDKAALPDDVVKTVDEVWQHVKADAADFHM